MPASSSPAPALGSLGPHRQHHEAAFLVQGLDVHPHVGGKLKAELGEHLAGPAHKAASRIIEKAGLEGGIRPCLGDEAGSRCEVDRFRLFGEFPVVVGCEETVLNGELADGKLDHLEIADLFDHRCGFVSALMVVVICHYSPLLEFRLRRTALRQFEPAIEEFGLQRAVFEGIIAPQVFLPEPSPTSCGERR
jgi:hypothetical protein